MEKLEWLKKYRNHILVIATVVISCMIYWNYLIGHFAAETYAISSNYRNAAINTYLADGRLFSYIFFMIASICNIPILQLVSYSVFLGIIILTIAVLVLKIEITKLVNLKLSQEIIVWLICYCIIFNFIIPEIMYFTESCIISLSILFYIIAAKFFTKRNIPIAFISMLIAIFCYQGTIGFFVVCCCIFSVIKHQRICKELVYDMIKIALFGMAVAILNLLFIRVITTTLNLKQYKQYSFNIKTILENILIVLDGIPNILINNCGLFPTNLMIIFSSIIVIFSVTISLKEKKNIFNILLFLLILAIISSCAIFVVQRGSFYTGRVHYCIGSMVGISILYLYCVKEVRKGKVYSRVLITILLIYFLVNLINTIQLVTQHQQVNKLEKEECLKIQQMIIEYESNNDIKVTKTVPIIIGNKLEKGFFSQISRQAVVTYNNVRHYWCYSGILNYYLDRKVQQINPTDKTNSNYIKYIKENDLNFGDIVCIEDTLYCPQYII